MLDSVSGSSQVSCLSPSLSSLLAEFSESDLENSNSKSSSEIPFEVVEVLAVHSMRKGDLSMAYSHFRFSPRLSPSLPLPLAVDLLSVLLPLRHASFFPSISLPP